jgi:ATP-dependent Lhr-like helicase
LPKGRLFPLTRDELVECLATLRSVRRGELDRLRIPDKPLDILAQQIVACAACEDCDEQTLFELMGAAYPYRDLTREEFGIYCGCWRTVQHQASAGRADPL